MSLAPLPVCIVATMSALAVGNALAASTRAPLGKANILYDTGIWRAAVSGNDAVTFTCIAPDCEGQPRVFARLASGRDYAEAFAASRREARAIRDDGVPPIPFPANWYSSGCRAADTPILFASGNVDGQGFIFSTAFTGGCNFSPRLPEGRFLDLLRGFETN